MFPVWSVTYVPGLHLAGSIGAQKTAYGPQETFAVDVVQIPFSPRRGLRAFLAPPFRVGLPKKRQLSSVRAGLGTLLQLRQDQPRDGFQRLVHALAFRGHRFEVRNP